MLRPKKSQMKICGKDDNIDSFDHKFVLIEIIKLYCKMWFCHIKTYLFINVLINLNNQKFALWLLELINLINLIYKIKLVVSDWKALSVLLFLNLSPLLFPIIIGQKFRVRK